MSESETPRRKPYVTLSAGEIVSIIILILVLFLTWEVGSVYNDYKTFKRDVTTAVNQIDQRVKLLGK